VHFRLKTAKGAKAKATISSIVVTAYKSYRPATYLARRIACQLLHSIANNPTTIAYRAAARWELFDAYFVLTPVPLNRVKQLNLFEIAECGS